MCVSYPPTPPMARGSVSEKTLQSARGKQTHDASKLPEPERGKQTKEESKEQASESGGSKRDKEEESKPSSLGSWAFRKQS